MSDKDKKTRKTKEGQRKITKRQEKDRQRMTEKDRECRERQRMTERDRE